MKVFDHAVIYNGIFYPANTAVPIEDVSKTETTTQPKAVKDDDAKRTRKPRTK